MAYNCKRTQNSEKECLDGKTTVQPFSCLSWFVLMHGSWFVHFGFFLCCGVWYYVTMYVKIPSCTKGNLDCNMYTALIHVNCDWKHYVYMYSVHTCIQSLSCRSQFMCIFLALSIRTLGCLSLNLTMSQTITGSWRNCIIKNRWLNMEKWLVKA